MMTLMFSLICVWITGWVNNCEAGDLRRQRGHYDVIVMKMSYAKWRQFCVVLNVLIALMLYHLATEKVQVTPHLCPLSRHCLIIVTPYKSQQTSISDAIIGLLLITQKALGRHHLDDVKKGLILSKKFWLYYAYLMFCIGSEVML